MAKIARKYCNKIYVTDDNPRTEKPASIRKTITKYLKNFNYTDIPDRAKAIKKSILESSEYEIILVAGKGHETHQTYGLEEKILSDKKIVKEINLKKKLHNKKNNNQLFNSKLLEKILKKNKQRLFIETTINSKKVKKNNLFIAMKGKKKDGNNYAEESLRQGASYCIVSKKIKNINKNKSIRVKNTNIFLNRLAELKRKTSDAKIIAITGSSGKTTLKTVLGNVLSIYGETYFSPKSYNNHFGVPLSLSNLEQSHKFGVFEVGMSRPGEIKRLSNMVKPEIAVITNIAEAHIENFKNLRGIAKAKSEIINNIQENGTLILNRDDKFYNYLNKNAKKKNINTVSFGLSKNSDVHLVKTIKQKRHKLVIIKAFEKKIILKINSINIYNILSSIAVIKCLKLDIQKISNLKYRFNSLKGRGKSHNIKRYKTNFNLIDDSYNANPSSVKNAINNLFSIKKNNFKKYVLLGDMLELGIKSEYYHKDLSQIINNSDIDKVFVYGEKILNTYKYISPNKRGNILQNIEDFDDIFSKVIKKNDYLMIKGSNATGLNKLTNYIIKGANNVI